MASLGSHTGIVSMLTKRAGCSPWQRTGVYPMPVLTARSVGPYQALDVMSHTASLPWLLSGVWRNNLGICVWMGLQPCLVRDESSHIHEYWPETSDLHTQASSLLRSPHFPLIFRKFAEWALCSPETFCLPLADGSPQPLLCQVHLHALA